MSLSRAGATKLALQSSAHDIDTNHVSWANIVEPVHVRIAAQGWDQSDEQLRYNWVLTVLLVRTVRNTKIAVFLKSKIPSKTPKQCIAEPLLPSAPFQN
jgi:hypothetical protein